MNGDGLVASVKAVVVSHHHSVGEAGIRWLQVVAHCRPVEAPLPFVGAFVGSGTAPQPLCSACRQLLDVCHLLRVGRVAQRARIPDPGDVVAVHVHPVQPSAAPGPVPMSFGLVETKDLQVGLRR